MTMAAMNANKDVADKDKPAIVNDSEVYEVVTEW
jgi:hypothetical protein